MTYELCLFCDHFVEENDPADVANGCAEYIHMDDGDQEYIHDACPSGDVRTDREWRFERPDLFWEHRTDGVHTGPNSPTHVHLGPWWVLEYIGTSGGTPTYRIRPKPEK